MSKYTQQGELSSEEIARRSKYWAIGNNILEKMRKENEWKWKVKRKPKQSTLDL
jgi:hypothetical protein